MVNIHHWTQLHELLHRTHLEACSPAANGFISRTNTTSVIFGPGCLKQKREILVLFVPISTSTSFRTIVTTSTGLSMQSLWESILVLLRSTQLKKKKLWELCKGGTQSCQVFFEFMALDFQQADIPYSLVSYGQWLGTKFIYCSPQT